MKDPYYGRSEVSNSDLSALKKMLYAVDSPDPTNAYKFGTLIDCMITESHRVNYSTLECSGEPYTQEDFDKANEMKKAFLRDDFCRNMLERSTPQKVMINPNQRFVTDGFEYYLPTRSKWDLFMDVLGWGGDIKSTTATTHKQFVDAIYHFDYDRQRAWYMDMAGSNQDVLIGISKVNFKVFKVPIKRGDELYRSGKEKVDDLAFKYWMMFA
ncbi:PDDEXK-like uncharacterized protein DUF3799 [Breznakibacter xylanolyticus]|uniref:PDDEXK-like uncharacterized protein DUF3799 n=1 Tax=Breznakibacter xylanolyticus TaxID=990 RepID=A0A2W7NCA9_9BACT|nr:PD-(D/E)XK nuclease-like domain-containing protein [Breznakibacter xylanolyticus]PZX18075.1 PDDEXK-like uncharacterized protein DUF3799 [Breznakibacter xylanolyticus]